MSLQPLTLTGIWIVQLKPIAPFATFALPIPDTTTTQSVRHNSRSKQNAKIGDPTI
ncbi:hypothetical protein QUA79_20410 [Microcoleus sp. F8-D1]